MALFAKDRESDTYAVAPVPERLRKNEKIIILTADNTEDLEFFYPYYRLTEEGYTVDVITPDGGKFEGKHGLGLKKYGIRQRSKTRGLYSALYPRRRLAIP